MSLTFSLSKRLALIITRNILVSSKYSSLSSSGNGFVLVAEVLRLPFSQVLYKSHPEEVLIEELHQYIGQVILSLSLLGHAHIQ